MNDPKIKFVNDITFEDFNPHNFHLKNDYINNILNLIFSTLSFFKDKKDLIIKTGFLSKSYIKNVLLDESKYKYSKGKACDITWQDFNADEALIVCLDIFKQSIVPISMLIDLNNNHLTLSISTDKSIIKEIKGNDERIVRK